MISMRGTSRRRNNDSGRHPSDGRVPPPDSSPSGFDADTAISPHALAGLLGWGARTTGDPLFALHLAEHQPLSSTLSYLVMAQPTLCDALAILVKFQALSLRTPMLVSHGHRDGHRLAITLDASADHATAVVDYVLCTLIRAFRRMLTPLEVEVHLTRPALGHGEEYDRAFGCRARVRQDADAILFPRTALSRGLQTANAAVAAHLQEPARAMLAAADNDFRARVRAVLYETVRREEPCSRGGVARRLAVSTRTLQRRLEDHDTGFRDLVDEVRRELALDLLADPAVSLFEIAMRCGFSDQSAFTRACHRWTGMAPNVYRGNRAPDTVRTSGTLASHDRRRAA